MIKLGTKVKWNDPDIIFHGSKDWEENNTRIYEVIEQIGDDTYLIADDYGEVKVYEKELIILT